MKLEFRLLSPFGFISGLDAARAPFMAAAPKNWCITNTIPFLEAWNTYRHRHFE